jgi:hypothetical protein
MIALSFVLKSTTDNYSLLLRLYITFDKNTRGTSYPPQGFRGEVVGGAAESEVPDVGVRRAWMGGAGLAILFNYRKPR